MKIRDLITQDKATLSFEVFPPKKDTDFADVEAAALGIAAFKPDYMSVTYGAGGSTKGHTIQLAREIQEKYDVPTIAHLTCVCASKEGIKTALADMKNAGIENILALRGDIPKNYDGQVFAEFSHASELVELIKETGDFCVGGACYPEVHPDSANKHEDIIGLKKKVDAGCDYLTTQMFFDNNLLHKSIHHFPVKACQFQLPFQHLQTCHFWHIHICHLTDCRLLFFDILPHTCQHVLICLALFQICFFICHFQLVAFISFTQILFN